MHVHNIECRNINFLPIYVKLKLISRKNFLRYNRPDGRIAQSVRAPLLHRGGRRFEPYSAHFEIAIKGVVLAVAYMWEAGFASPYSVT